MGWSQVLTRVFIFITNFSILLAGIALLVVGILFRVHFTKFDDAIPSDFTAVQHLPNYAIGMGAIIVLISFLGYYGALKKNSLMLSLYGAILIVIFLLQVWMGIYGFDLIRSKGKLKTEINTTMTTVFLKYSHESHVKTNKTVVDLIQQQCECCGTYSPLFWSGNITYSCYRDRKPGIANLFTSGCSNVFPKYVINLLEKMAIAALCISLGEVVGAVLAFCLSSCIQKQRRPYFGTPTWNNF